MNNLKAFLQGPNDALGGNYKFIIIRIQDSIVFVKIPQGEDYV